MGDRILMQGLIDCRTDILKLSNKLSTTERAEAKYWKWANLANGEQIHKTILP